VPTDKFAQPHTKSGVAAVDIHRVIYTIIPDLIIAVQLFSLITLEQATELQDIIIEFTFKKVQNTYIYIHLPILQIPQTG
jgi:hypothetical protein